MATYRLRFAPAPTGYLHLGSARAALFNWLYAEHLRGQGHEVSFQLRIEDTDVERSRPELIALIIEVLTWLGISWDGEPVLQSTRSGAYAGAIERLIREGHAYRCRCSQAEVKARAQERGGGGYDGFCRDREVGADEVHVVRFRVPDSGSISFEDLIRGSLSFDLATIEDFVIRRSDGSPVFIVANAVDDAEMGITHVVRGEDLINVTPKVLLVREALGFTDPLVFAHMPLIVNEARKKLSKRRDDVSVGDYIERGFLPGAMVNYLALLGWGPPDGIEVRPVGEIIELFDIADVNPSSAMFDVRKLEAINGDYLRALTPEEFTEAALPFLRSTDWFDESMVGGLTRIVPLIQPRVKVLSEVPDAVSFLFCRPQVDWGVVEEVVVANPIGRETLALSIDVFGAVADWSAEALFAASADIAARVVEMGGKKKFTQAPARLAITGATVGPPLFDVMEFLGRDESLARMRALAERIE